MFGNDMLEQCYSKMSERFTFYKFYFLTFRKLLFLYVCYYQIFMFLKNVFLLLA